VHLGKAHFLQSRVELLIPYPGYLVQAIERLPEPKDMARLTLLKSIRLLHADLLHRITIEEGIRDVDKISLPVLKRTDS
jgi:hypothetical protein